ncbi:MAG: diacylglycerol kinase family protein [Armatimonadota bacterium]
MGHPGFPPDKTAVLVGSGSRSGAEWLAAQDEDLKHEYLLFHPVRDNEGWSRLIRAAREKGAECIAVAGGDGTLRRAARLVIESGAVLGVIPTGTGNSFASEIGASLDPAQALLDIREPGHIKQVDLGDCEGEPFVNAVTLGLTAVIARELKNQPKGTIGKWAYIPAVIQAYETAKQFPLKVTAGDQTFEGRALQCVVAVTKLHGGPFVTTPEAAHDDGKLSVYVVSAESRADLLVYATALVMGKHTDLPSVWSADAEEVIVEPSMPRTFVVDGDRYSFRKATIKALRHAISVFVIGNDPTEGEL